MDLFRSGLYAENESQHRLLIFSREENRLDILSEDGSLLGGLHCGDRLDVLVDHKWTPTRVEYDHDWYLFGLYPSGQIPVGLEVRGCT